MTLGQRIQALRKQHGLSQEALGEKLGVSRQAISRWEMDGAVPEVDKLIAMSKLFHVSLDQLLGVEPSKQPQVKKPRLRPSWPTTLLAVLLAVSLALNAYFYSRVLKLLDPPTAPLSPVETVEYAFLPDYETMTVDLALSLQNAKALRGWEASWSVYSSQPLDGGFSLLHEETDSLQFRRDAASIILHDIPFAYHGRFAVYLLFTKDSLEGNQILFSAEPTGRGIPWITAASTDPATNYVENPALLSEV